MKVVDPMDARGVARALIYLLCAAYPLGTRYIVTASELAGVPVEWGTVSVYATQLLLGGALVAAVALAAAHGDRASGSRGVVLPGALLLALMALGAPSALRAEAAAMPILWVFCGLMLVLCVDIARPDPTRALIALVVGAVAQAGLGLWQFLAQRVVASTWLGIAAHAPADLGAFVVEAADGRWLRAYGTLPHPNLLGAVLAVGIVAAVALALHESRRVRSFSIAALPLLAAALCATFSRSAALGLVAALTLLAFTILRERGSRGETRRRLAAAFAILIAVAGAFLWTYRAPALQRAMAEGRLETRSVDERRSQLVDAAMLFSLRPLLGIGAGQTPFVLADRDGHARSGYEYQPIHSTPVLVAVETGALGLLAWVWVVVASLRRARIRQDAAGRASLAVTAALLCLLVASLFDHYAWTLWPGQLSFWLLLALL